MACRRSSCNQPAGNWFVLWLCLLFRFIGLFLCIDIGWYNVCSGNAPNSAFFPDCLFLTLTVSYYGAYTDPHTHSRYLPNLALSHQKQSDNKAEVVATYFVDELPVAKKDDMGKKFKLKSKYSKRIKPGDLKNWPHSYHGQINKESSAEVSYSKRKGFQLF